MTTTFALGENTNRRGGCGAKAFLKFETNCIISGCKSKNLLKPICGKQIDYTYLCNGTEPLLILLPTKEK
jgi:hypothetical protein